MKEVSKFVELTPCDKNIELFSKDLLMIFQIEYKKVLEFYKELLKKPENEFQFQRGYVLGKMAILEDIISNFSE